jgi:hypothetical protein
LAWHSVHPFKRYAYRLASRNHPPEQGDQPGGVDFVFHHTGTLGYKRHIIHGYKSTIT